jgi:hypothetical protein
LFLATSSIEKSEKNDDNKSIATTTTIQQQSKKEKQQASEQSTVHDFNFDTHDKKHYDDSAIGKELSRGRLSIKCIEGLDIRRRNDTDRIPRNDPFLKFRLTSTSALKNGYNNNDDDNSITNTNNDLLKWKTTVTKRKQDSNPKFDDEVVFFDLLDPMEFVVNNDVQLFVELWNKSTLNDEKVGTVSLSVVRFFFFYFLLLFFLFQILIDCLVVKFLYFFSITLFIYTVNIMYARNIFSTSIIIEVL